MYKRALVAILLTAGIAVGSILIPATAQAYNGDTITQARSGVIGGCAHNTKTHVLTCIRDTYTYPRIVKYNGRWHRKKFVGIQVSAQHCKRTCWGPIIKANLWAPHQHGHAAWRRGSRGTACDAGLFGPVCTPVPVHPALCFGNGDCAQAWGWYQGNFQRYFSATYKYVTKPCVSGAVAGVSGKAVHKAVGALFNLGMVSTVAEKGAKAATGFAGPDGYAIIGTAGCAIGVGANGYHKAISIGRDLADRINPFNKNGATR